MHFQHSSDVICGPIVGVIVHTTSLGGCQPLSVKRVQKEPWPGSRDTVNFCALNANSSKMAKDTNFKFGMHAYAPSDNPDDLGNFFSKRGVVRVM